MKVSKYFELQELVPPSIFKRFGITAIQFIRPELLAVLDLLREKLGRPVIVNNWHTGGKYQESGYRTPRTKTGADLSMHKMGIAGDIKVPAYTKDGVVIPAMLPREILAVILANHEEFKAAGMTTYENPAFTPTWLHIDCRQVARPDHNAFRMVNP